MFPVPGQTGTPSMHEKEATVFPGSGTLMEPPELSHTMELVRSGAEISSSAITPPPALPVIVQFVKVGLLFRWQKTPPRTLSAMTQPVSFALVSSLQTSPYCSLDVMVLLMRSSEDRRVPM